jgi:hypothetical protein
MKEQEENRWRVASYKNLPAAFEYHVNNNLNRLK